MNVDMHTRLPETYDESYKATAIKPCKPVTLTTTEPSNPGSTTNDGLAGDGKIDSCLSATNLIQRVADDGNNIDGTESLGRKWLDMGILNDTPDEWINSKPANKAFVTAEMPAAERSPTANSSSRRRGRPRYDPITIELGNRCWEVKKIVGDRQEGHDVCFKIQAEAWISQKDILPTPELVAAFRRQQTRPRRKRKIICGKPRHLRSSGKMPM